MKHLFIKDINFRKKYLQIEKRKKILKFLFRNLQLNSQTRLFLQKQLEKLKKKSSQTKIRNRCSLTYRGRGIFVKKFKLSRNKLRELLSFGLVPGYQKAIW